MKSKCSAEGLSSNAEINKRMVKFWDIEKPLLTKRLENPDIAEMALRTVADEELRGTPVRHQQTLYQAAQMADEYKSKITSSAARKAAAVQRKDVLQNLIEGVVLSKPTVSVKKLLVELRGFCKTRYVIDDIDDKMIVFRQGNGIKSAPRSGLKDRLWRAKNAIKRRSKSNADPSAKKSRKTESR